jgi:hypothetical protein
MSAPAHRKRIARQDTLEIVVAPHIVVSAAGIGDGFAIERHQGYGGNMPRQFRFQPTQQALIGRNLARIGGDCEAEAGHEVFDIPDMVVDPRRDHSRFGKCAVALPPVRCEIGPTGQSRSEPGKEQSLQPPIQAVVVGCPEP